MNTKSIITSALLFSAVPAFAGTTALSLDEPELIATTDSGWRIGTSMYVWTTRLDGDMTFHGVTFRSMSPSTRFSTTSSSPSWASWKSEKAGGVS
jgi:hypothetical protein